jgi:hypothetical protein
MKKKDSGCSGNVLRQSFVIETIGTMHPEEPLSFL